MVRLVTDDDIGLKVLRETSAEASQIIDIVAIHGIGAHPDESWCKNVGTAESPQWASWLDMDNMLPAVVPNARIMRYGYQSQWFGEGAMRQNASTVARRLLLALNRKREESLRRPLFFIAHCFGGLVVLKALVEARFDEGERPGISKSTAGLIFLGTPFRGAEGMSPVEMLEAARSEYQDDEVERSVLNILEPGNEFLEELVDQFGKIRTLANIACFYELKSSNVGKIVGNSSRTRFVVSKSSGCLDQSDTVSTYSLSRTHFDMNKFGKPSEEDFETIRDVVRKMTADAHHIVTAHYENHHGSQIAKEAPEPSRTIMAPPNNVSPSTHRELSNTSRNSGSYIVKVRKSSSEWSEAEDEWLLHVVQTTQPLKWKVVAQHFDRNPWACQKRHERLMQRRN